MPFAITISEKGGAERREVFDKNEISVGRVQGNDLMLPKGNVSKRHAKLTFKDGRFIVTDLKSTNGTYVNGRKIAQATIVREGDKIYVGDFVLRFEAPAGAVLAAESAAGAPREADHASAPLPNQLAAPPAAQISHYPLEHDPDDTGTAAPPRPAPQVPQPPRVPSGFGAKGPSGTALLGQSPFAEGGPARPPLAPPAAVAMSPVPASPSAAPLRTPPHAAPSPSQSPPPVSRDPSRARDAAAHAAHRLALATLVDRVSEMIDLSSLRGGGPAEDGLAQRIERAIREQVVSLRQDGEIAADVDVDALARDGQRELLALGPVGPLLDDDDVSEIHASRDVVWATRGGQQVIVEPPFSSEEALARVVARLAAQAGAPLVADDALVERQLNGARLVAALGPVAPSGPALTVRKRRRADGGAEDPVRAGVVSRGMWTFLSQCMAARLNVVLSAPVGLPLGGLLMALLATIPDAERPVIVQSEDDPILGGAGVTLLECASDHLGRAAEIGARLGSSRFVVSASAPAASAAALEAAISGRGGVVVVARAPGLRHALQRLSLDHARSSHLPFELARECAHSAFDLGIELFRQRDGRTRVVRVAEIEPGAPRDVFQFAADRPGGDGSFAPTGHVPRFVEDLRLRGVVVDPTVFDRQSVRSRDSA